MKKQNLAAGFALAASMALLSACTPSEKSEGNSFNQGNTNCLCDGYDKKEPIQLDHPLICLMNPSPCR